MTTVVFTVVFGVMAGLAAEGVPLLFDTFGAITSCGVYFLNIVDRSSFITISFFSYAIMNAVALLRAMIPQRVSSMIEIRSCELSKSFKKREALSYI